MDRHFPLVLSVVKSLHPRTLNEYDEYVQCGRIGLLRAIRQYKQELGTFSSFAWSHIRWEILGFIQKNKECVRMCKTPFYMMPEEAWEYLPDNLTKEEKDIFMKRLEGYSIKEIAEKYSKSRCWINKLYKSATTKIQNANS